MLDGGPGHAVVHGTDPFAEFASIFNNADIAVCNLECTVAKDGTQVLKPYAFCGPVESIRLLKRHFSAVSLANNHSGDFGKDGLSEELSLLEAAGVPWFGGGRNRQEAHRPLILERKGLRIALLGYNDFPPREFEATDSQPGTAWLVEKDVIADIQTARTQYHADLVIPYLHWGNEDHPEPDADQRALARRLIDAGASAIVGSHPHVTETVDIYKGRPILYSLGNFVFDYFPVDPPKWIGWVVKLNFNASGECDLDTHVFEIDKAGIPHLLPLPPDKEDK
jgi:poly-gamma-glutamate capsule biosynthesis protein CapA/YwtB (metallophosphatase superfamily)